MARGVLVFREPSTSGVAMPDEPKTDSRDRAKPDAPEDASPTKEQRRFRGPASSKTAADGRRKVGGDTAADAPMDPEDEAFLDDK
jgi:hypothetical protein